MARYGKRVGGHLADAVERVSTSGKQALIFEVIEVQPTSDVVTVYNSNQTAYGTTPTSVTTGAAILAHIKAALWIGVTPLMVTGAPTTTTAIRPPVIKMINGPTTVATIYCKGLAQAGGSGVSLFITGHSW